LAALNKVLLIGHLGRDPEIKYTQDGTPVANFAIATGEVWKDKSGDKQERTEWHNIVAWGRLADIAKQYLAKGRQVYIEGKLQTRKWSDRDGNERKITEVVAGQMILLGGRSQDSGNSAKPAGTDAADSGDFEISDNDIPF
jgi:single-strand DNA-binding protein